jgi:hypothetical protein
MRTSLITAAALVVLTTTGYAADTGTPKTTTGTPMNQQQSAQSLPQEIQSKLQQDGYTDVQVVPGSFLVSAKDKHGDLVNMVIGPHSMLVMTEGKMGSNESGSTGNANQSHSQK